MIDKGLLKQHEYGELKKIKHYNQGKIEVIDLINDWELNFNIGNVIKYISRCRYKNNKVEDLLKAKAYLDYEIKYMTSRINFRPKKYKVDEIISDWKLEGNLEYALIYIYTYVMSNNLDTLEVAIKYIEDEIKGGLDGQV